MQIRLINTYLYFSKNIRISHMSNIWKAQISKKAQLNTAKKKLE
jgi:hypothetical protein